MTTELHPILSGIEVVVFDKDGTLISFEAMWVGWARDLGTRLEMATRRPVAGDVFTTIGFDPVSNRILPGGPLAIGTMGQIAELCGAVLRRWCPSVNAARRILADAWFEPDPVASAVPLADLPLVIATLRDAGLRIAVATTDDRRPTIATLDALGIAGSVEDVVCGDDEAPTKPDPATLVAIAGRFGVPVERVAMVGDTPADLRMARGAGAGSIGVTSGIATAAELAPDADVILDSIAALTVPPRDPAAGGVIGSPGHAPVDRRYDAIDATGRAAVRAASWPSSRTWRSGLPIDRTGRGIPALLLAVLIVASACGTTAETTSDEASNGPSAGSSAAPSSRPPGSPDPLTDLAAAAEQEGALTTIGLSHEWCGYGEAIEAFTTRYAITIKELNPGAGFDEQLAAVRDNRANPELEPDVIDVDVPFAARAKAGKLLAPYKVATWDTIPQGLKDGDAAWYGGYYGVLVFETNTTTGQRPPVDWADLLQPARKSDVALAGDPRVSTQAIATVYAAALANGGSLDKAQAGLDFFAKVQKAGNLQPTIATVGKIDDGTTPVTVRWTYNALAHRDVANGQPAIDVSVPATGRLGGAYAQAISAFAPHPNAAKLWMEFLFSDEGQAIWLKANCYPVRLADLEERGAIPPEVQANLLDTEGTVFPTLAQLNAATALITVKWNAVVGVDIR